MASIWQVTSGLLESENGQAFIKNRIGEILTPFRANAPPPFFTAKTKNNFAQILGSLKSYRLPKFSLAPNPPFLAAVRQRGFPRDAPLALRGADERRQSEAIADAKEQGWAGRCGGSLPARANAYPHAINEWVRLSIYNGGAQDSHNTGSNHRRRNRSPAWLLALRSVERSRR